MGKVLLFHHPGYDGKGIPLLLPLLRQLFQVQVILLYQLDNGAGHAEHICLALPEMHLCIAHFIHDRLHCFLYLLPGAELDGRNEFRFVLAVKAQLSPAYRLHVIDVDGASGSHDGLIAKGVHGRLIGAVNLPQVLAAVADTNGNGHLQNLLCLLADISQHVNQSCLAVILINGSNKGQLRPGGPGGSEYGRTAIVSQLFLHYLHDGNGNQIPLLVERQHISLPYLLRLYVNGRGHPLLGSCQRDIIFSQLFLKYISGHSASHQLV